MARTFGIWAVLNILLLFSIVTAVMFFTLYQKNSSLLVFSQNLSLEPLRNWTLANWNLSAPGWSSGAQPSDLNQLATMRKDLDHLIECWDQFLEQHPSDNKTTGSNETTCKCTGFPSYEEGLSRAARRDVVELMKAWSLAYQLDDPQSKAKVVLPEHVPIPPHLEDCAALESERLVLDKNNANAKPPEWLVGMSSINVEKHNGTTPQPPWILGADSDNLARTRIAQTHIWLNQHPPDCKDRKVKFLLAEWWPKASHGIGSGFHGMSVQMQYAVDFGRVLVPMENFEFADHEGCEGDLNQGRLDCYYWPVTSEACRREAHRVWQQQTQSNHPSLAKDGHSQIKDPDLRVAYCDHDCQWQGYNVVMQTWMYVNPWDEQPASVEHLGRMWHPRDMVWWASPVSWWRAQSIRYLLRWPSQYLCRLTNRARHEAFGRQVAAAAVATWQAQQALAAKASTLMNGELEKGIWRREVYIPRPIISIHVRQGDKAAEMELSDFKDYMAHAYRIRRHNPSALQIWLSTEMQPVVDETVNFPDWKFYYTDSPRVTGQQSIPYGRGQIDDSFVNLRMAEESDFFVGTLGSNWNRLIDELRKTNGKLWRGHITLNVGEW